SVSATLLNGGQAEFDGSLLLVVRDAADKLIGSGPLTDDRGFTLGTVALQPGESIGIVGHWNSGQFAPGTYRFELRLVEHNSINRAQPLGVLVQHQSASFTITPSIHFVGTVAANPPIIQAGLGQAVHFNTVIKNDGNVALAAQTMTLTVSNAKTGTMLFTATAPIESLPSQAIAQPDFGSWVPVAGGNDVLTVTAAVPDIGRVAGTLYVGNVANANFTVNPQSALAGTRTVHANIHVSGVDPAHATVSDPLTPLIRKAIQDAITYNDKAAQTWVDTNRCTSCHISNQALIGGESTRALTTFDRLERLTIINNVSTNQAADGSLTAGYNGNYHRRLGSLTLWGLLGYHAPLDLKAVIKRAADWVVSIQSSSGAWSSDYNGAWFDNNVSMSMLNLSNLRRTMALLGDNHIASVPAYTSKDVITGAPASSRGFLAVTANGNFYTTDRNGPSGASAVLSKPDGTLITRWSGFNDPRSIVVLPDGQVWLSSTGGTFRLNADGTSTLLAADNMVSLAVDGAGQVWGVKSGDLKGIYQLDATGKATPWLSNGPFAKIGRLNPESDGNLYVTDLSNAKVYCVHADKTVDVVTEVIQGNQSVPALLYVLRDGDHWLVSASNGIYRFNADWVGQRITWSRADQLVRLADGGVGFVAYQQAGIHELLLTDQAVDTSMTSYAAALDKGETWLQALSVAGNDNLHMAQKLWGLGEAYRYYKPRDSARADSIHVAMVDLATKLRANQAADGGWGRRTGNASDALVTAQTGIALDYLNPSASDPVIRKAVAWLLTQQQADGSWVSAGGIMATHESTTTMVAIWLPTILDRLGSIDAEVSATFAPNVQPAHLVPTPSQLHTDADGNTVALWLLTGVTDAGEDLGFDLTLQNLAPDEVRPVAVDAHLTFHNSFNQQAITQPIAIPEVTGLSAVTLIVMTDQPSYPVHATAMVTTTMHNLDGVDISGTLAVNVYDAMGVLVGAVTEQNVSIPAQGTLPITAPFAIGTILPAQYTVQAVLSNSGATLANAQTNFSVLPDKVAGTAVSTLHTDKHSYNASDRVLISSSAKSLSSNVVLKKLILKVVVYDSSGTPQFSHNYAIAQLLPDSLVQFSVPQVLSAAAPGIYTVKQDLVEEHGSVISHVETTYVVSATSSTGAGLAGSIAATPHAVRIGNTLTLAASASNAGNADLNNLPLIITLIDPSNNTVMGSFTQSVNLAQGASAPFDTHWVSHGQVGTTYFAVLSASIGSGANAKTVTLAQDTFQLQAQIPAAITATGGTPQAVVITNAYPQLLQATVLDTANQPLAGVSVTFTAPLNGASVSFPMGATAMTDTNGNAVVAVRANGVAGQFQVSASAPGVASTALFDLHNTLPVTVPVPINPWMMLLLAGLLGLFGMGFSVSDRPPDKGVLSIAHSTLHTTPDGNEA
ncbi:MAG: hypothetical protein L0H70_00540, partial [Xanthomonadales bacterium]|nr:hypothetical protein [Xanthomonadales bacterium]